MLCLQSMEASRLEKDCISILQSTSVTTLRPESLDNMLSVASLNHEQISKGDSKSSLRNSPSTRAKPDLVRIRKEISVQ